jgi:PTH1 family peptidyl-tRNA hydrolase
VKLVVGLGNPGRKYEGTRHNAGFWLVERFAARAGIVLRKDAKFQALVGRHEPTGTWLLLPQGFMNASGRPVQMLAGFFRIMPAEILVAHDELDFAPGIARIKQGGGVAGHNGLKDISGRLGTHDYWRLRIGIGHPGARDLVTHYLLNSRPSGEERAAIGAAIDRALEVMPLILAGDVQGAMLKLHTQEKVEVTAPERRPDNPDPPAVEARPDTADGTEKAKPAAARKTGALDALLKKFLPDADPARKK